MNAAQYRFGDEALRCRAVMQASTFLGLPVLLQLFPLGFGLAIRNGQIIGTFSFCGMISDCNDVELCCAILSRESAC